MNKFIGRVEQLKALEEHSKIGPGLIVIRGRRRIGKSRLVQEYAKNKVFLEFSGLAPVDQVSAQRQRDHFANQLVHQFKLSPCTFNNWYDAFIFLSDQLTDRPTVIFFDEVSWMGEGDPDFIPKLKAWWDTRLQKHSNVQLILCSSISTWVEKNIINSTALFGRISLKMALNELTLPESYAFLKEIGFKGSDHDVFKLLSVTGGVPWYLKQVNPQLSADENIAHLCFRDGGILANEFEHIFNDLYNGYEYVDSRGVMTTSKHRLASASIAPGTLIVGLKENVYKNIIFALGDGMKTLAELRENLGYEHGGSLGIYLKNLCIAGFVTQHHAWSFKTHKEAKQSLFRLSDNYVRFYIKYMKPNWGKIRDMDAHGALSLPGWESIMGLQVENLLLNNRPMLLKAIGIKTERIVADNPYIQKGTKKHKGCQVDYLVQTHENTLFICEFKFQRRSIGSEILDEMKEKVGRLSVPRGFGKAPVLVHISDLADSVMENRYFYKTIDLRDWLN